MAMTSRRFLDVLLRASLLAVPVAACTCPDDEIVNESIHATRAMFATQIDACLADDRACATLCSQALALALDPDAGTPVLESCIVTAVDAKGVTLAIHYLVPVHCGVGRRPDGFLDPGCPREAGAGAWLARIATLEAASVTAFARLVHALERFGAPRRLVAAARRAIGDELLHARLMAQLAVRFGGVPTPPVIEPTPPPTLAQLAHENAVEGQVGETFGALVASCQARLATDPEIRAVFAQIAHDESRHAALAHQLAPWLESQLGDRERATIADVRGQAAAGILEGFESDLDAADRARLGLPATAELRGGASQLFADLQAI